MGATADGRWSDVDKEKIYNHFNKGEADLTKQDADTIKKFFNETPWLQQCTSLKKFYNNYRCCCNVWMAENGPKGLHNAHRRACKYIYD